MSQPQSESDERLVQVWFGAHVVESHVALPDPAASYEAAMRRRFPSLLVTNEPAAPAQERV